MDRRFYGGPISQLESYMENLIVWSVPTTEKILRDKTYCETENNPVNLLFEAAKNEYESAQVLLTPRHKNVDFYTLEIRPLKMVNGSEIFSDENFTIYNQKYIEVKKLSPNAEHSGFSEGWYPDALLPFEKAKEYKENNVKAGDNQGIFISVKVPKTQKSGEYEGNFILSADGKDYIIPVKVIVWNFEIPDEVHCQSDFVIGSNGLKLGENNYFPEMYAKYVEKLIEFRLAPHRVIQLMNLPYNEGKDFANAVRRYAEKGNLSTIMLPVYPHPVTGINEPVYRKFALALAEAADEDGVNYFDKAAVYCGFIDEPQLNGTWDEVNRVCKRFEDLKCETADEFLAAKPLTEFRKNIAESMKSVNNYVTIHFDERITEVKAWCPGVNKMDSEEVREKYRKAAKHGKNWWYQCGVKSTEPNYGIDASLLGARLLMWMTYDYGLGGTLYWETVQYYKWVFCAETHCNHEVQIDCYKEAVRCAEDNGDGFLFYPGKPYGIFGPVESIRLHAIRDGFEEYEYLYLLDELCKKAGRSFKEETKDIFSALYKDVTVIANAEVFAENRRKLADKIVELQKDIKG